MSDIEELERRITAALDRIGQGVETLSAPAAAPEAIGPDRSPALEEAEAEVARLREALEAERSARVQLEERIGEMNRADEERAAGHEAELRAMRIRAKKAEQLNEANLEQIRRVRHTNHELRQSIQALREAATEDVADPALINRAVLAELEGLRAVRDTDRQEIDTVLRELKPLLQESAHA